MVFFCYTQCKLYLLLLSLFLGSALAAMSFGRATVNPEYPGMYWVEHLGRAYPVGGSWALAEGCGRVDCYEFRGSLWIQIATCGAVGMPPGCHPVTDEDEPYPDCCPYPKCDGN